MKFLIHIFLLVLPTLLLSQSINPFFYDEDHLPSSFHKEKRQSLRDLMPENSVAVFFSNPIQNRSNDVDFEFHQEPNFYYFTGFREPNALLLVFKEPQTIDSIQTNEIIFIQGKSTRDELWNGRRKSALQVREENNISTVLSNKKLAFFTIDWSNIDTVLILPNTFECTQDDDHNQGDLSSMKKHMWNKLDKAKNIYLEEYLLKDVCAQLRVVKDKVEISLLQKAIDITCISQKEMIRALLPGNTEYQAEAIVEFGFKYGGAESPGFPSIMGAGENSCVLHYTSNRRLLNFDDLLVSDIGAEYRGYTADICRTIPVSGKFTEEQAVIYNIVLTAQEEAIKECTIGKKFWDPHQRAVEIITQKLIELEIIKDKKEYRKYFMHGTSHYLGLDVHDLGTYESLKSGHVITVEPGIYIPEGSDCDSKWWNIGVRIEDDILITEEGPLVLSNCVPKKIPEIEKLMKEKSIFNRIKVN